MRAELAKARRSLGPALLSAALVALATGCLGGAGTERKEVFAGTVRRFALEKGCNFCHDTQFPAFASSNLDTAYLAARRVSYFDSVDRSGFIDRANDLHCGIRCGQGTSEIADEVAAWAEEETSNRCSGRLVGGPNGDITTDPTVPGPGVTPPPQPKPPGNLCATDGNNNLALWVSRVKPAMVTNCKDCHTTNTGARVGMDLSSNVDATLCLAMANEINKAIPDNSPVVRYPRAGTGHDGGAALPDGAVDPWLEWVRQAARF
jgi:hypothetical protein